NLRDRLGSQGTRLSGGEQQMLAIARILRTGARLLLLDEPTEGLAPVIIQQIRHTIGILKAQGFTVLLVEQNFQFAATVADRHYVMEHGRIVDEFSTPELKANMDKLHEYLGVWATRARFSCPPPPHSHRHRHPRACPAPPHSRRHGRTCP